MVLFFGTPREHKGLIETAKAISASGSKDVVFVIAGGFPDPALKQNLQEIKEVEYLFLGPQSFRDVPEIVALGDICVLHQVSDSLVSQYQTPAKLSDALGMGLTVILQELSSTSDVTQNGAAIQVKDKNGLLQALEQALAQPSSAQPNVKAQKMFFKELSFAANIPKLRQTLQAVQTTTKPTTGLHTLLQNITTLTPFCLLIDHASPDKTETADAKYKNKADIQYLRGDKNNAFFQPCNYGAALTKHPSPLPHFRGLEPLLFSKTISNTEDFSKRIEPYFHPSSSRKIVVYTAIFGTYDQLRDPEYVDDEVDYLCFTDQGDLKSEVFEIIKLHKIFKSSTKCARMLKTLPHIFLPGYDVSVWVDSSTKIRGVHLRILIEEALKSKDVAVHSHFQRNCVYKEAQECIAQKKDDKDSIERHVNYIQSLEYPLNNGLVETGQVIRRNCSAIKKINERWWGFIRDYSVRDQLSFNVVCWQEGIRYHELKGCTWLDQYFKNYLHTKGNIVPLNDSAPVTMVMLVRSALEMTKKSVDSILRNTDYPNFRLVIVDNDSNSETKAYLQELKDTIFNIDVITNSENLSFSRANNEAVRRFPSDYILFINNDIEIIERDWLTSLVREMKSNPKIGAVGPVLLFPDYTIQSAGIKIEFLKDTIKVPAVEQRVYRHSGLVDGITGGCMLVRKSVHDAIGGFDERFFYGQEDIDYCLKIREAGYNIKLLVSSEAIHHESHTRAFSSRTLRNREVLRLKWKSRTANLSSGTPTVEKRNYLDLLKSSSINFKSFEDLVSDIKKNVTLIPERVDIVVGIPRSGMVPAYVVGLMLNRPVISSDEFMADLASEKGDRLRNEIDPGKKEVYALFVDDSINNGNAFRRVSALTKGTYLGKPVIRQYVAVYGSENWRSDEVMTLSRCQTPRIFQWNYTNHGIAQFSCYDLDGVLCVDPMDEQNDDSNLYRDFVLNARPLYIPKYSIKAIVTSRLEKYRDITEQWLKMNGVNYEKLYMLDLPSKKERIRLKIHGKFKSEIYASMSDAYLFVESNSGQAAEIAKITKKPVVCTENDKFYS